MFASIRSRLPETTQVISRDGAKGADERSRSLGAILPRRRVRCPPEPAWDRPEHQNRAFFVSTRRPSTYTCCMPKNTPDNDWFMQQVELEQSGLRGFIRMLGVRPESVDDIAQETFVVAYKKLAMFERGTNFGAWLRTIARNLVRNELRRQGRRRVLANEVAEFLLSRADEKASHPAVEVEQTEQRDQQVAALRDCLQQLPERSRRLVQQRYFEQLSLGVIAAYENTNANNISQILFRLRAALSNCIQERLSTSHS
jgi:RNA polymerase sigma-70 factor (ECF subfamily)